MAKPIYLDYQATTPLDPRVLDAMLPYYRDFFGNPHSSSHRYGWEAKAGIDIAREQVAVLINAKPEDIIFTSGATEANNLALKGVARALRGRKDHIITVVTEHKCVLEAAAALEREGTRVTYFPVKRDGLIDLSTLEKAMTEDTALVSVMAVNNEIGVIQPLSEIGALCRARDVLFHSDVAQGFGKMPLDVEELGIDLMSISAHKIYGPKGVGALYRRLEKSIPMLPHMDGGGQEADIRSGTLSPALCVGFGVAAEIAGKEMASDAQKAERHWHELLKAIRHIAPDVIVNGSVRARLKSNLNVSLPGADGSKLLSALRGVAVSSGAACASAREGPSYVLAALAVPEQLAQASLRIGFGRFTSDEDIAQAAQIFTKALEKIRMGKNG